MYRTYRRLATTIRAQPYIPGTSLEGVSVAPGEVPESGDMVATDGESLWLIKADYWRRHYDTAPIDVPAYPRDER